MRFGPNPSNQREQLRQTQVDDKQTSKEVYDSQTLKTLCKCKGIGMDDWVACTSMKLSVCVRKIKRRCCAELWKKLRLLKQTEMVSGRWFEAVTEDHPRFEKFCARKCLTALKLRKDQRHIRTKYKDLKPLGTGIP